MNSPAAQDEVKGLPRTLHEWKRMDKSIALEALGGRRNGTLKAEDCWWYPWNALRSMFAEKGYILFTHQPTINSNLPYTEGPWAADSFGLYGRRGDDIPDRLFSFASATAFAARDQKNRHVVIKVVDHTRAPTEESRELQILKVLNSEPLRSDPRNTTVPVLEYIKHDGWTFAVMPFQDGCADHSLRDAAECLELACQVLDALAFLHEHGIAHLDIAHENILVNYHSPEPRQWVRVKDDIIKFDPPPFHSTFPIKYQLMDFDLSTYFMPGIPLSKRLIRPEGKGRPSRAPEVGGRFKFNPFSADVYQSAVVFWSWFGIFIYTEVPELLPLLQDMSSIHPPDRLSMKEAAARMRDLYDKTRTRPQLQPHTIDFLGYQPYVHRSKLRTRYEFLKHYVSQLWKIILFGLGYDV